MTMHTNVMAMSIAGVPFHRLESDFFLVDGLTTTWEMEAPIDTVLHVVDFSFHPVTAEHLHAWYCHCCVCIRTRARSRQANRNAPRTRWYPIPTGELDDDVHPLVASRSCHFPFQSRPIQMVEIEEDGLLTVVLASRQGRRSRSLPPTFAHQRSGGLH